jgi:hypothetical protein
MDLNLFGKLLSVPDDFTTFSIVGAQRGLLIGRSTRWFWEMSGLLEVCIGHVNLPNGARYMSVQFLIAIPLKSCNEEPSSDTLDRTLSHMSKFEHFVHECVLSGTVSREVVTGKLKRLQGNRPKGVSITFAEEYFR